VAQDDQTNGDARGDAAPDSQAAVPDRKRTPPVVRHQIPAGQIEVEPPAKNSCWKGPERDLSNEAAVAAVSLPAAGDDRHRGDQGNHIGEAVCMDEERSEM
jgi:hypothetical protein